MCHFHFILSHYVVRLITVVLSQALSDAREDAVAVTPRHLFSVIFSLVKAGHSQHGDQVR